MMECKQKRSYCKSVTVHEKVPVRVCDQRWAKNKSIVCETSNSDTSLNTKGLYCFCRIF